MSWIKEAQKEMATSVDSLSKHKKSDTMPTYPSRPNPPPQTQFNNPKAQIQSEDELHSSEIVSSVLPTPPTSPQSSSNLTLSEQKPVESQHPMAAASDLKKSLGLGEFRCGCHAQERRCRIRIPTANKNLINPHIESMLTLTRSSPKLEADLNKLFELVHCHHHGDQKGTRLEEWKIVFPIGNAGIKPVVSIEKQIIKVFGQLSARCIWISLEGELCKNSIGGQSVQNCAKTIDEIAKSEVYLKDIYLDYLLKVLETNMYCPDHIGSPQFKRVVLWKSKVIEIRETATLELMQPIENDLPVGFITHQVPNTPETGGLSTKKINKLTLPIRGLSTRKNLQSWSSKLNQDPVTFWPKANDTSPFHVIVMGNGLPGYDRVQSKLQQPLGGRDLEDGYVYLYQVEGNERFVKIGWTADSVKVRHEKWAFDCNRNTTTLYPTLESATRVPNARRVEALCHEELYHCRITISCKGCLKKHTEWFETSPTEAIAVIKKWSNWITTRPYQLLQLEPKVKLALKEKEMRRVSDIGRFMNEISVPVTPTVTSELKIEKVGDTLS
ncbi:uncharacterized protein BHQ10_009457 [Talaromyces amestolkiae]|uniref:Bacteriophage T5 Orf172 DNA-binding domain-containing protein n=1 Tax=Talaromyces amestolkiae TaxID=1196081 RepID=A0A364LC90_TALAM|nr:uncharacterized protein BHQ10_009457 [Talaromyces amestolkiae]RAO73445.1 hypothetical protein BHQ10_009457 [Talaromyces amestolkiae]